MLPIAPLTRRKLTEDEFYALGSSGRSSHLLSVLRAWLRSGARWCGKRALRSVLVWHGWKGLRGKRC